MAIVGAGPATATGPGTNKAATPPSNLSQILQGIQQQAGPGLQLGNTNLQQLLGTLGISQAQTGAQAGALQSSTGLQEQQLGVSGANIGIQQQQLAASAQQAKAQQGYELSGYQQALQQFGLQGQSLSQQGAQNTAQYGFSSQSLANQLSQNTTQYGYQQQANELSGQSLANQLGQNTSQYGYQQQQNQITGQGLQTQYGLAGQSYGSQLGNLAYQSGQQAIGAQSSAVASGGVNTAGYANTQQNIAQQFGYQGSQLANQFASTTASYNQALQSLGVTEQAQGSAYQYGQQQLGLEQQQLGVTEGSEASAYGYGQAQLGLQQQSAQSAYSYGQSQLGLQQQQLGLQEKQAQTGQASEASQYKYSQSDVAKQQATLSNIAKSNGISEQQAASQLNSGLAQLGLQGTLDTAGILSQITNAAQGQVSGYENLFGDLSLASGLGGIFNQGVGK